MWGYGSTLAILFAVLIIGIAFNNNAYGGALEWKSEYSAGILEPEKSNFDFNLKTTTYDKQSIKIDWDKSPTFTKVQGYKLMRKTLASDYTEIAHLNSKQTSFIDGNLADGYYGYKIVPVVDDISDKTTKHGITRTSSLFKTYVQGQEVLAKEMLRYNCPRCHDPPFQEIADIKWYDFPELDKRQTPQFQKNILKEITRAENTMTLLLSNYKSINSN